MKTIVNIAIIFLLSTKNLFALFGVGDIVSDPTSYTYYAQQIKAMNDQLKSALDQLDQLNKVNDAMDKANDLIFNAGERIYNPATQIQNLVRDIERTQSRFESLAEKAQNLGAERFLKNHHNINTPLEQEAFEKWKNNISALFNNSEDEKYQELREELLNAQRQKDYLKYQQAVNNLGEYLRLKKIEQEALQKASLRAPIELFQEYFANEEVVKLKNERKEQIKKLSNQINTEKDMLKQQQTTNEILILLIETVDKQYEMQMRYYYAMAIPMFKNESVSIELELKELKKEREEFDNANRIEKTPAIEARDKFKEELSKRGEKSQIYNILSGKENFHEY